MQVTLTFTIPDEVAAELDFSPSKVLQHAHYGMRVGLTYEYRRKNHVRGQAEEPHATKMREINNSLTVTEAAQT